MLLFVVAGPLPTLCAIVANEAVRRVSLDLPLTTSGGVPFVTPHSRVLQTAELLKVKKILS